MSIQFMVSYFSPDGLVVRAIHCGQSNPGSNTGLDTLAFAKQTFGRRSRQTDHRKTTDSFQIHEKVS